MIDSLRRLTDRMVVDWYLFIPAFLISLAGLATMNLLSGENYFFVRQGFWLLISIIVFFIATSIDWRFLRQRNVVVPIFGFIVVLLTILLVTGEVTRGVQSWFQFGFLAFQPSDPAKIAIILMLAKYFSRRHIEIKNVRHILISGFYALIVSLLIFLQPDFGGAVIVAAIWLGMVLVSGISKKHLAFLGILAIVGAAILWMFVFAPYQKDRIVSFIHPLSDIHGAGYNAYQSTIAVGSGELLGKGIGQGSQSKLRFLPEYETDFIFAAFVEEWGFIGGVVLLSLFLILLLRIISNTEYAATNFESFFGIGIALLLFVQLSIHASMNMGLLPVTGITFPFMSYGGSHLLTEWIVLGILSSMNRHSQGPRF